MTQTVDSKSKPEDKEKKPTSVVSDDPDATVVSRRWKFLNPTQGDDDSEQKDEKAETIAAARRDITEPLATSLPATVPSKPKQEDKAEQGTAELETGKLGSADAKKNDEEGGNQDMANIHVLVVEDNVPNFVLIARLLAFMGIKSCEWKTSGWQVVEFADTLPQIDLILLDIRLPYEDGYQALKRIRNHDKLKDTLVIAVTAEASADQMKKARESGFDGFLAKPLNPDKFPDQIKRILAGEPVWEWQS